MSVRFAIVGCGNAARQIHLPELRARGVDVTAFASRSRESAESVRDAWGSGAVVDRWEDAVTRDDVDAVLVAVPNFLHREVAVAAAQAGKHILCDKPLGCTTADADQMIAAAIDHAVVLVPFHNTRFATPFVAAQGIVASGRLGEITGFRTSFGHGGPQTWAPEATWFFDPEQSGGGCLIDLGVHMIDLVRYVTGEDITSVAAVLNRRRKEVEHDAQLLVSITRGAIGTIHASWSSRSGPDHQLTVIGTDGTVHLDTRTPLTFIEPDGARERVALPDSSSSPLAELLAAIAGERAPSITAHDGRAAVAVVEAAYMSAGRKSVMIEVS